jgi:serine protease Do
MDSSMRTTILTAAFTSLLVSGVLLTTIPQWQQFSSAPSTPQGERSGDAAITAPKQRERLVEVESRIVEAVKKAEPAVVSVIIAKDLPVLERYYENPFEDDFFFDPFSFPFEFRVPRYREKGTEKKEVGGGTAFFISADGMLMTNKHVVADEEAEYTVLLNDGRKIPAEVVARDSGNDIALLKAEGGDFPALSFASDELALGQTVIAIGNALGEFRNTVSVGVISGLSRSITAGGTAGVERLDRIIQTDAAINRGNSGGPLLNSRGEIIGMNTAVAAAGQNIGFAIPYQDLQRAYESYKEKGRIVRPYLGIRYMPITKELKERNALPYDYGALVSRGDDPTALAVVPGSPADKAGITENDIILEADGERLTGDTSLAGIVQGKSPGDTVRLKVFSKGKEREITVTLEERK